MSTLTIEKKNAIVAYEQADTSGKQLLANLFGKKHFVSDMTELIDSFEAACEYNNTNPNSKRFTEGTEAGIHLEKLAEIAKALNGGRVMKPNEKRWYGYFIHDEAGFRLDGVNFDIVLSLSYGGPRLCCLDEKLARYMCTKFIHYFNHFLNPSE
jgi:hypothetical protein